MWSYSNANNGFQVFIWYGTGTVLHSRYAGISLWDIQFLDKLLIRGILGKYRVGCLF